MQKYALSIDELEQNNGIDFFCNLPDALEDEVESSIKTVIGIGIINAIT